MDIENLILHELTDEEIGNLTDEDYFEIIQYYDNHPLPIESTVKGLLQKFDLKYDDLTEFIQNLNVGICNNATRSDTQIYISRKDSPLKDNIRINLHDDYDAPDVTIQIQVMDDFVHEEAYTRDGLELYRS